MADETLNLEKYLERIDYKGSTKTMKRRFAICTSAIH
jgi:hypothetical protein